MKALSLGLGAMGILIPMVLLAIAAMSGGDYPAWSPIAWPTMILLMPYGGSAFNAEKIGVAVLSITLNGALYSIIGFVVGAVLSRLHRR